MELPDALSTAGMPPRSIESLLHLAVDGEVIRLSLETGQAEKYETVVNYSSPISDEDAAAARWLLEDHPRLQGRSSDPIASRIEKRLDALAGELRRSVFESAEGARPIRDALGDRELVRRLHVVVEEKSQPATWTPWELMLGPGGTEPLSVLAASFSRISTSSSPVPLARKSDSLRVLLVTCRPSGEDDVPFRSVASRIVQAVAASTETAIHVDMLRPPTYSTLQAVLAAASEAKTPYDVVHFDGHGSYEADVFDANRKRCYLYFEGEDGGAEEVSGSILGTDLAREGVRYLLLNACRSAYVESNSGEGDVVAKTFGTLADEVRAAGVAGVLAMGFNLYVVTAARLVADTYAALAAGCNLSQAVGHARRELYRVNSANRVGAFDWLVPVVFSGGADEEHGEAETIPKLIVQTSTTTPTSAAVIDPGAIGGPRSDERPFFGYDDILSRLDRVCGASRSVEIVGIAGAGKSALVGEFVRWWVATTSAAALVLDVDIFTSFAEFDEEFQKRWVEAQQHATNGECLIVLDGASNILDAESESWTTDDRIALQNWIAAQASSGISLLITGRTISGQPGVETIVIQGLDTESRAELATFVGFSPEQADSIPGMLPWSQGIPAVVLQIPLIIKGLPLDNRSVRRKLLSDLRSGKTELAGPQLGMALIERTGLKFFDVSHLRRAALPFVLHLFQSHVADGQWQIFCELAAAKGLALAGKADALTVLEEELRPAMRAGLVSRIAHGYVLHPLAPIAIEPGLAGTMQAMTSGTPDLISQVMGIVWVSYIQAVSVAVRSVEFLAGDGAFGTLRRQRENLTNAVEISTLGAWWGLALPLLHKLRDALRAEARDQEWQEILDEVFVRLRESPPQEQEMGPESAPLQIIRLVAEEAERDGNEEQVKALRELQLQMAYAEDMTITPVEPDKGNEMDVDLIRRISALLKRGDAAARENSPDCMVYYNEAFRLSEESNDIIRRGEIHYAIATAHLNVTTLRNPAKYEFHAREAIKAANLLGPFGLNLLARASVSLGNAIVEEQRMLEYPDLERLSEARQALNFGAMAEKAGGITRGSAHNGLGNLLRIEGDIQAAADEYLAACKEFEAAGDTDSLQTAQTNAAIAHAALGRLEDARSLTQAMADLTKKKL